jgi:hypothetical protein
MSDEDNFEILGKLKDIDKKALAGAIGLMLMSWAALPIVYILIAHYKKDKKESGEVKENGK